LIVGSNGTKDIEWFDLPRAPEVTPDATDTIYTVTSSDTIDGLADTLYGDPRLWDVIADVNLMRELPQEMTPNTIIRLPSRIRVTRDIRG
jgi:nucleoid-associated protein YgaU